MEVGVAGTIAYRDKRKLSGVFVRFSAPLHYFK
jgi:hypothetical protein